MLPPVVTAEDAMAVGGLSYIRRLVCMIDVQDIRRQLAEMPDDKFRRMKQPAWAWYLLEWKWQQVWEDEYNRRYLLRPALDPGSELIRPAGFEPNNRSLLRAR